LVEAKLILRKDGQAEQEIVLTEGQIIGRSEFVLSDDPKISKRHAEIMFANDAWHLTDLQSTNGTYLNGSRLLPNQQAPLQHAQIIRLGDTELLFHCEQEKDAELPTQVVALKDTLTVGRDADCDIVLDYPNVSRRHCRLTRAAKGYRLEDLHSRNGTYLNRVRIAQTENLNSGDEVRVGLTQFIFRNGTLERYEQNGSVRLDAVAINHIVAKSGTSLQLLHEVEFVIPPKEFVAIVGASGAGKTTLLNALTGFRPATKGQILLNGADYYSHRELFRTAIGYVPQEDIVHRELTVAEALRFAAQLRLPPDTTADEIERLLDSALQELELSHRKNASIGTLSGGERKRVNVGMELLTRPSLLFLDEPTSGLDPGLERKFVDLVHRLTREGRTIVIVTHATSSIAKCDKLLFMARGGRIAFYGPPQQALQFFGVDDYADIYLKVNDDALPPEHWQQNYRESEDHERHIATPRRNLPPHRQGQTVTIAKSLGATRPRPALWGQFQILFRRYIATFRGDVRNLKFLLAQSPIIALLLLAVFPANVFNHDSPAAPGLAAKGSMLLFCMVISALLFGIVNAARELTKERPIYRRERLINLRILPYLLSKIVVLSGLCVIQSILLGLIVGLRIPYGLSGTSLVSFYLTLILANLSGLLLGLLVSALANSNDQAMTLVPIAVLPQIIFSGLIDIENVKFLSKIMPSYWAYGAMGHLTGLRGKALFDITTSTAWPALLGISVAYFGLCYMTLSAGEKRQG
jgi:ABC transport system ATP-binding/permease protein